MIFHGEIYAGIGYEDLADSVRIMRTAGLEFSFQVDRNVLKCPDHHCNYIVALLLSAGLFSLRYR